LSSAAIVVRRIFSLQGQYTHTAIDVTSQELCKVLKEVNEGVEGIADFTKYPAQVRYVLLISARLLTLCLQTTIQQLYHSRLGLDARLQKELSSETPDAELISDLRTAFQLLDEDLKSTMENFERLLSAGEITYDLLWMLFVPNAPVYHYHLLTEQDKVLQGRSVKFMTTQQGDKYADISCRIVTFNGRAFGYGDEAIQISHFDGVCKIRELKVYPLGCHADMGTVREAAVRRGKKYAALGETSHHQVSGRSIRYVQDGVRGFWASLYLCSVCEPR
jgi:hypothetical protein